MTDRFIPFTFYPMTVGRCEELFKVLGLTVFPPS